MEEDPPDLIDFNFRFNAALEELLDQKGQNTQMFSKVAYEAMIHKVKESQAKVSNKKPEDYQRLKRFGIINARGQERLITRPGSGRILYYVHAEEVFQILHDFHEETKHGGREPMTKVVADKYKNITREMIMLFIKLCPQCVFTQRAQKSCTNNKRINLWAVCILNIIDLSGVRPDPPYKYVLAYQEYTTKYILLKPIKKKCIEEVADNLIDIFTLFGAPKVMWINRSETDEDFIKKSFKIISEMWPAFYTTMRLQSDTSNQICDEKIKNCIERFVGKEKNWSKQIRFLQFQLNNNKAGLQPFEALFGKQQEFKNARQDSHDVVVIGKIKPNQKEPPQTEPVTEIQNVQNTLVVTCTKDDEPISYTEIEEVYERGLNSLVETHDDNLTLYTIKEEVHDEFDEENTTGNRGYSEVQSDINIFQDKMDVDGLKILENIKQEESYEKEIENTYTGDGKLMSYTEIEEVVKIGSNSDDETHDDIISLPYTIKEEIDEEQTTGKRSYSDIQNIINIHQKKADIDAMRVLENTEQEESFEVISIEVRKKPRL